MARILAAASPEPRAMLERMLAGHELVSAETVAQAEQLLSDQSFAGIVCTILFDESRMFDLLRLAKSRPGWQRIPFACARLRPNILDSPSRWRRWRLPASRWGAVAFLDIADYQQDADREMREAIERSLVS